MHDLIIHREKAAEKQDLGRAAQEKDAPCALPASRKNWEAEVKCSCSSYNPFDSTAARPGLCKSVIYNLKSESPNRKITACQCK